MAVVSLKTKLAVTLSLLVGCLFTAFSLLACAYFEREIKETIEGQQFTLVSSTAEQIDGRMQTALASVVALGGALTPGMVTDPDSAQAFLDDKLSTRVVFDNGIFLFSSSGRMIAETPFHHGRRGQDFSYREYFRRTMETGRPYISLPYRSSQVHHHPSVNFTAPVRDATGTIIAVVAGSLDLMGDNFLGELSRTRIARSGYLCLFATDRTIIIHPDGQRILQQDVPPGANRLFDRAIAGFEGSGETTNSRGTSMIASYKRLRSTPWILAALYPTAEAFEPVRKVQGILLPLMALTVIAILAIVWGTMHLLTVPITILANHMREISRKGGARTPLHLRNRDEIGDLAETFNTMMTALTTQEETLRKLSRAVEQSASVVVITDTEGRLEYANPKFSEVTGYALSEVTGENLRLLKSGETPAQGYREFWETITAGREWRGEFHNKRKDGQYYWALATVSPIKDDEGRITHYLGIQEDVTRQKLMEEALRESEANYHAIFDAANDAIFVLEPATGVLLDVNRTMCEVYGYSRTEALGLDLGELSAGPPAFTAAAIRERVAMATRGEPQIFEWLARNRQGQTFWVEINLKLGTIGGRERLLAVVRDIAERKELEARLVTMAHHDNLTGLPNRNLLEEKLGSTLAYAARYRHTVALMFVDVDDFKGVNDSFGHAVGDLLLKAVADVLSRAVRESDTVARLGGDEFIVLLAEIGSPRDAGVVARKIFAALAAPLTLDGVTVEARTSIGIAVYPGDGEDAETLMRNADAAMYLAKEGGRNTFRYFNPADDEGFVPSP
jgi:diguanylate cyclase (GGDEF)-like protein/PAS domain S-box-containing protein